MAIVSVGLYMILFERWRIWVLSKTARLNRSFAPIGKMGSECSNIVIYQRFPFIILIYGVIAIDQMSTRQSQKSLVICTTPFNLRNDVSNFLMLNGFLLFGSTDHLPSRLSLTGLVLLEHSGRVRGQQLACSARGCSKAPPHSCPIDHSHALW